MWPVRSHAAWKFRTDDSGSKDARAVKGHTDTKGRPVKLGRRFQAAVAKASSCQRHIELWVSITHVFGR